MCFFSFLQSVNKPFCSLFIPLSRDFVNIQDAPYFSSSCILWSEVIECKLSSLYSCNTGRVFWNRWHSLGKSRVARIIAHLRGSQGQIQATSETNGFCGYVDLLKRRIRGSIKNSALWWSSFICWCDLFIYLFLKVLDIVFFRFSAPLLSSQFRLICSEVKKYEFQHLQCGCGQFCLVWLTSGGQISFSCWKALCISVC